MRAVFGILGIILGLGLGAEPSAAQYAPQPAGPQYLPGEILDVGGRFFGGVSGGLAQIIERTVSQWGLPNGYILGHEAGGAFVGGVRYGEGTLFTRNAGDLPVYWQGPSLGWDFGGDGDGFGMTVAAADLEPVPVGVADFPSEFLSSSMPRRPPGLTCRAHRKTLRGQAKPSLASRKWCIPFMLDASFLVARFVT